MESPVKKINFDTTDKENQPVDETTLANIADQIDAVEPEVKEVTTVVKDEPKSTAVTVRKEEIDEPILQENPQRFVLFPIKYHEVCDASRRVKWFSPDPCTRTNSCTDLADVQEG